MAASWRTFTHAARHCSSVPHCCSNSASVSPCMIARIAPIPRSPESILHRFRGGRKGGDWLISGHSKGRFVLGLGSQVKAHNERRFSTPWIAPAARLGEYVEAVRAIFRCWEYGEKLNYQGQYYNFSLMTPEFSPPSQHRKLPPIAMAAV